MEDLQGRGAATGLPSRGVHLLDPVVGALPWGHPSGAPSLELPRVQMVSLSLLLVVGETRLLAAPREGKATSSACSNRTPIRWSLTFKSARATGRRGSTPKELSEKFGILHTVHPRAGPSALSSDYPPDHRKGRKSLIRYHLAPICLRLRPQFTASLGQKGGL